ncbi:MFS transporter [Mycobacterium paraense]|uniref:MFS transporter n=1 Tax=Mycobacterium paraense TaxID=767916 RepID=UPI001301D8EC|nr:MFS transporter [Mycobacterium paraense]MCV7442216.1 MFS transporter [Mycobacterium paraense]
MTSTRTHSAHAPGVIDVLDGSRFQRFHFKAIAISGAGFFTDAYDLTVIGTALLLIKPQWGLNTGQVAMLGSSALIASAIGAVAWGRLADVFGRKRMYGLAAAIMTIAAIASGLSPNFLWLLVFRFILGVAIGGDYPVSGVIMTEYANVKDRGRMVALMFSSYALGSIAGPAVALLLLYSGLNQGLTWRLLLALGAVPSLLVLYARTKAPESPRFIAETDEQRAAADLTSFTGTTTAATGTSGVRRTMWQCLQVPGVWRAVLMTAGVWFLFDIAYYGNTISSPLLVKSVAPHASTIEAVTINLALYAVFAVPAFAVTIWLIDKIGHITLQVVGLIGMAAGFAAMASISQVGHSVGLFITAYGISNFFTWFGPGVTTMLLAGELFTTSIRATGHGFASGAAKVGAFVGAISFPPLLAAWGLQGTEFVAAACCLAAAGLSLIVPEPARRSLDNIALTRRAHRESTAPDLAAA